MSTSAIDNNLAPVPPLVPAPSSDAPAPPSAPPALPAGYRFVSDAASIDARLRDVYDVLMAPEIYWGQDRSFEQYEVQVRGSWRLVLVLKGGEGSEGELAAIARVVSDGWE